jgi:hypothetical protein
MNWVEEKAVHEKLISEGYVDLWKTLCDDLCACVLSFRQSFPGSGHVTFSRNDRAGEIQIGRGDLTRHITLQSDGSEHRIAVYDEFDSRAALKRDAKYLRFASNGSSVFIVADEKALTISEASRLLSEDILFGLGS